jgi:hypothetical protein
MRGYLLPFAAVFFVLRHGGFQCFSWSSPPCRLRSPLIDASVAGRPLNSASCRAYSSVTGVFPHSYLQKAVADENRIPKKYRSELEMTWPCQNHNNDLCTVHSCNPPAFRNDSGRRAGCCWSGPSILTHLTVFANSGVVKRRCAINSH